MLSPRVVAGLRRAVLAWFRADGRRLGFRSTTDPWAILVAETMAHQTQISRVDAAWVGFVARFPTPATLAEAGPGQAVRAWQGLGYNRRAINLYRAARVIVEEHDGRVPSEVAPLQALPGVGPYTARAVSATAFGRPVGAVDTNVRRVLSRLAEGESEPRFVGRLQALADALVPPDATADWTHALMDLGALVCRPVAPRCSECPALRWCRHAASDRGPVPAPEARLAQPSVPFERTSRWLRGRIVDRLREAPPGAWVRFDGPVGAHDAEVVADALAPLERDGLVERDAADPLSVRLPGE